MNLPTKPPGLPTEAPITQLVTKLTDSQTLNSMIKAQRRRRTPRLRVINPPTTPTPSKNPLTSSAPESSASTGPASAASSSATAKPGTSSATAANSTATPQPSPTAPRSTLASTLGSST